MQRWGVETRGGETGKGRETRSRSRDMYRERERRRKRKGTDRRTVTIDSQRKTERGGG